MAVHHGDLFHFTRPKFYWLHNTATSSTKHQVGSSNYSHHTVASCNRQVFDKILLGIDIEYQPWCSLHFLRVWLVRKCSMWAAAFLTIVTLMFSEIEKFLQSQKTTYVLQLYNTNRPQAWTRMGYALGNHHCDEIVRATRGQVQSTRASEVCRGGGLFRSVLVASFEDQSMSASQGPLTCL